MLMIFGSNRDRPTGNDTGRRTWASKANRRRQLMLTLITG